MWYETYEQHYKNESLFWHGSWNLCVPHNTKTVIQNATRKMQSQIRIQWTAQGERGPRRKLQQDLSVYWTVSTTVVGKELCSVLQRQPPEPEAAGFLDTTGRTRLDLTTVRLVNPNLLPSHRPSSQSVTSPKAEEGPKSSHDCIQLSKSSATPPSKACLVRSSRHPFKPSSLWFLVTFL